MRTPVTIAGCIFILTMLVLIFTHNINSTTRTDEIRSGVVDAYEETIKSVCTEEFFINTEEQGHTRVLYPYGNENELNLEPGFDSVIIAINDSGYVEITIFNSKNGDISIESSKVIIAANRNGYVYKYTSSVTYENLSGTTKEEKLNSLYSDINTNMQLVLTVADVGYSSYAINNILFANNDINDNSTMLYEKNLYSKADMELLCLVNETIAQRIKSDGTLEVSIRDVDFNSGFVDIYVKEVYGKDNKELSYRRGFTCRAEQ